MILDALEIVPRSSSRMSKKFCWRKEKRQWSLWLLWCTNEPSENFGNFFRDVDDDDTPEGGHQQQQSSHNVIPMCNSSSFSVFLRSCLVPLSGHFLFLFHSFFNCKETGEFLFVVFFVSLCTCVHILTLDLMSLRITCRTAWVCPEKDSTFMHGHIRRPGH